MITLSNNIFLEATQKPNIIPPTAIVKSSEKPSRPSRVLSPEVMKKNKEERLAFIQAYKQNIETSKLRIIAELNNIVQQLAEDFIIVMKRDITLHFRSLNNGKSYTITLRCHSK